MHRRREVLEKVAGVTGASVGLGRLIGVGAARGESSRAADAQEIDTRLSAGVTLFDLNGDGQYLAEVVRGSGPVADGNHPSPILITSNGKATVDYAVSIVSPGRDLTLGGLTELTYDYYEGADNVNKDEPNGAAAPDETFLVVENDDGRHGMYLTYNDDAGGGRPQEQWLTHDVLARIRGQTGQTSGWFEYTPIEEGYSGRTFDSVIEQFGEGARLVRVGVGHGNAVTPSTLQTYYANLVINGRTRQFPVSVAKRVSSKSPF